MSPLLTVVYKISYNTAILWSKDFASISCHHFDSDKVIKLHVWMFLKWTAASMSGGWLGSAQAAELPRALLFLYTAPWDAYWLWGAGNLSPFLQTVVGSASMPITHGCSLLFANRPCQPEVLTSTLQGQILLVFQPFPTSSFDLRSDRA